MGLEVGVAGLVGRTWGSFGAPMGPGVCQAPRGPEQWGQSAGCVLGSAFGLIPVSYFITALATCNCWSYSRNRHSNIAEFVNSQARVPGSQIPQGLV